MQSAIEILMASRYRKKVYEKMMGGLCRKYRLTAVSYTHLKRDAGKKAEEIVLLV